MKKGNAEQHGVVHAVANEEQALGEAQAVARILIEDVLGRSYAKVLADIERPLDEGEKKKLDNCIKRLRAGEPVQYVVGSTLFCGNRIKVNENVLIPRPETEELAEIVIAKAKEIISETKGKVRIHKENSKDAKEKKTPLRIMDACTGSGCLAIALKKALPESDVCACDISEKALALAQQNAEENGCKIHFFQADLLGGNLNTSNNNTDLLGSNLNDSNNNTDLQGGQRANEVYDIIVSNPPYVMEKEKAEMETRVLDYEPGLALFVPDEDPLVFYKALALWSKTALAEGGVLACEINAALPVETADCFLDSGFRAITVRNDFRQKPRFLICQK